MTSVLVGFVNRTRRISLEEMTARTMRLDGHGLVLSGGAKTFRVREGTVSRIGRPAADATERSAGFDILECAPLNEAMGVAEGHPVAGIGAVASAPSPRTEPQRGDRRCDTPHEE